MPIPVRPLEAGDMRWQITIQTVTPTQSESGEPQRDWSTASVVTPWAEWVPGHTREGYRAQQRLAAYIDGVYRIYDLSPRPSPDENTRIIGHDGRVYDLKPYVPIQTSEAGVQGLELPVVARGEQP